MQNKTSAHILKNYSAGAHWNTKTYQAELLLTEDAVFFPEVYGPALSRDHVVFGAALTAAVDCSW